MNKEVLAGASCYNQKYFFNPEFAQLPQETQADIKTICVCLAQKIHGVFLMGFYEDGSLFFSTEGEETDFHYDEIGAQLEIDKMKISEKELIQALQLWYVVFKTEEGKKMKDTLVNKTDN